MDETAKKIYDSVSANLDFTEEISDEELFRKIDGMIAEAAQKEAIPNAKKKKYRNSIFSAFRRFDILSLVMDDEEVTEVMVNKADRLYYEKQGCLYQYPEKFTTKEKLDDIIQTIASEVNRRVNEAIPMADARLKDGSRVNIVLPPVAIDGPAVTIRRFPKEPMSMTELIQIGAISSEAAEFLGKLVEARYNIFISGGTGAGKTTFLGALAEYIPADERVITIEDSAELRLRKVKNLVRLESRPPTIEGDYEVTIRDLIRNALRMRPDRIIVGEIRSEEALDMLQAMNTGHDGSLSTGHANSAKDMLARIETMVLMGKDLPLSAIRNQIAAGIDILVHLGRLRDKSRKVLGIYEILGIKKGEIQINPLFEYFEKIGKNGKREGALFRTDKEFIRKEKYESVFGAIQ